MRILFTGGLTGGHFYPIIAIAKELTAVAKEEHALPPEIFFMAPDPFDKRSLFENNITYLYAPAGKVRRYFSVQNFFDLFKTGTGVLKAIYTIFNIYPDVVFGKGGGGSFPALFAARLLRIPVIIHESDTRPGRVNTWAGKFAREIAVAYPDTASFFPEGKATWTGMPVRKEITMPIRDGAYEFLKLEPSIPTILVLGGSLGSQKMNDALIDILPALLEKYQIIHQTGEANYKEVVGTAQVVLENNPSIHRYKPFGFLNELALRMSASVATIVITRAGSSLFEIASWRLPAIVIPISPEVSHDQTSNAFAYARSGAATVIEEKNLSPHVLEHEINQLMDNDEKRKSMIEAAMSFSKPDAARKIAKAIFAIAIPHEA